MENNQILAGGLPSLVFTWLGGRVFHPETGLRLRNYPSPPNYTHVWWVEQTFKAAQKVARIEVPRLKNPASGFLIEADLLVTNKHVMQDKAKAKVAKIDFNYRIDKLGKPTPVDTWECDPDTLRVSSTLDLATVRLRPKKDRKKENLKPGDQWGWFDIADTGEPVIDERANVIHYPRIQHYQQISFRGNQICHVAERFFQYYTSTSDGSSGSPVMDDCFRLIGMHEGVAERLSLKRGRAKQGIPIKAILDELPQMAAPES